jgi:hypothetical protein
VETLAHSSRWHCQGHSQAWNMVGGKCWDLKVEGYQVPNTRV